MPNLEELKNRAAAQEESHNPPKQEVGTAPTVPVQRTLTAKRREEITALNRDAAEQGRREAQASTPEKVALEELPEGVKKQQELEEKQRKQGDVTYQFTVSDNPDVRTAIEARCSVMDFGDLLMTGRVGQKIPILVGKLDVAFQSLLGSEVWWIERRAVQLLKVNISINTWIGYAKLVFSLTSINGVQLPKIAQTSNSEPDQEQFDAKFATVLTHSEQLLDLMMLNYWWFNDRVKQLYANDFDLLKNG